MVMFMIFPDFFSKDVNTMELICKSRKRIMMYDLGSYLLNESIGKQIFSGILELHKIMVEENKYQESVSNKTK
jgi:hypothetical protein